MAASAVFLGLPTSGVGAQQTGTISGRVVASTAARTALDNARVIVLGTALSASTNREGFYTIANVPAGTVTVRAVRLGYTQGSQVVTVTPGATVTADFALEESAFTLAEITVTAAGEARKLEVGNTVHTVLVSTLVEKTQVTSVSQVLMARAPGVVALPSTGTTGGGTRIRIRGSNSISLSNEPIFIVDGVRVASEGGSISVGTGGQAPSRLNDLNPEDIEDIQILKGPAASAIYGTGGSNGVVLIRTRRGAAGKPRWNLYTEQGILQDRNAYPDNVWGGLANGTTRCILVQQAAGTCTVEQIQSFNPMRNTRNGTALPADSAVSPLSTGIRRQMGANVSGGTEAVRYFISGEWETERGVLEMPGPEAKRLMEASSRTSLRPEEMHPNTLNRWALRANTDVNLSPKATGGVNIGYVTSTLYLPQNDNNVNGIHSSGLNGDGRGLAGPGFGWGFFRPGEVFQRTTLQTIWRLTTAAHGEYRPTSWFVSRGTLGLDQTQRQDQQLQRFDEGPAFGTQRLGQAIENRRTINLYTAQVSGTATRDLTSRVSSRTTAGFQYNEFGFRGTNASGEILPGGFTTVSAGAIKNAGETNTTTKSAGAYVEQVFGLDDKLFVTGALRFDKNSSTGIEAKTIVYPKTAISWLTPLSGGVLTSLRVRGAYGEAGQQPTGPIALETYGAVTAAVQGGTAPAAQLANLGDPTLKAERSREFEAGLDVAMFDNRVGVELTGYTKRTVDALIFVPTPVSSGSPNGQFRNLGETKNEGLEMVLNADLLRRSSLSLDMTLTGSLSRSEMVDLGGQPTIFVNGVDQQVREGYSIGGYWARPYTFSDANGDGIIVASEITFGDSAEYVGPFLPTRTAGLSVNLGLFRNRLTLSSTFDYRGGHYLYNLQEDFRCRSSQNCRALYDINTPLDLQARVVALRFLGANNTRFGFMEKADYMKWREASVIYTAPASWARAIRAERLTIGLTGRNLALFTGYTGPDPEVNGQGEGNFAQRDFLSLPPLRMLSLRFNVTF